ncbi:MAG: hypothetical protein K9W44_16935 [Candidatus Lokiarchaeota archaeon]|nr:hypothetical protein [Candidatus Harpocratesius repetitus]
METQMFLINQGNLTPLKKAIFTSGDAYLVVDHENKKIYIWLGSKCSVDEKGTAAVEARRIDDGEVFNGQAKIITIDEGEEPPDFMRLVQNLKVLDKNLAKTMLKDVSTGEFAGQAEHVDALYRISSEEFDGINAIKYTQVPFERDSLDSEDCFIADLGVDIWIWQGKDSNVKEKVKAMQFAREFDADRAGAQRPRLFIDGEDDSEFMKLFEGYRPKQDRATVDLHPEAFDSSAKSEPKPESKPEPAPESKPEPTPEEKSERKTKPTKTQSSTTSSRANEKVLIQKTDGRITCPKCGNTNRNLIREVEDRSNIIMDYPVIYGKKWVCGKCGAEWRKSSM